MERKIGEVFEYEDEWYQCIVGNDCENCAFNERKCYTVVDNGDPIGDCCADRRKDNKDVIFKKLEKVGEPVLYGLRISQRYKVSIPVELSKDPSSPWMSYNLIDNLLYIEVKQDKTNTEDMESNEKAITVPEGWEFDRIDESGNIVLKEKKKELPKTWLGCLKCVNDLELIEEDSNIHNCRISELSDDGRLFGDSDRNMLPQGLGKSMLALCQLLVCRNAWWKQLGWKPYWTDDKMKYCISYKANKKEKNSYWTVSRILAFPTPEVRDQFLDTFGDLIEEAKDLL